MLSLVVTLLFNQQAFGQNLYQGYQSIRALGMGSAVSASISDSDTLFYNPANLCRSDEITWRVLDSNLGFNVLEAVRLAGEVANINSVDDYSDLFGADLWLGGGAKTALTMPCFGVSLYAVTDFRSRLVNPALPSFNIEYFYDQGIVLGGALEVSPGFFLGATVDRITRQGGVVPVGPGTLVSADPSAIMATVDNLGSGFAFDLGATYQFKTGVLENSASVIVKNIGFLGFTQERGSVPFSADPLNMVYALSTELVTPAFDLIAGIDYQYANRTDIDQGKKLNLGAELRMLMMDLRAGFNQGYYTMGFGIDLFFLRIDGATWGVERGVYPGQNGDRRYAFMISSELSFDPNFAFQGFKTGAEGRSRLKQRR